MFLLDADLDGNDPYDRRLTDHLYGGDTYYRLCQETILGLAGAALLQETGLPAGGVSHERRPRGAAGAGSAADRNPRRGLPRAPSLFQASEDDRLAVAKQCVFTTHTPVPAGHDQFGPDQMYAVLGDERSKALERFGCMHNGLLNMTYVGAAFFALG